VAIVSVCLAGNPANGSCGCLVDGRVRKAAKRADDARIFIASAHVGGNLNDRV
jgi:hypothetical protein